MQQQDCDCQRLSQSSDRCSRQHKEAGMHKNYRRPCLSAEGRRSLLPDTMPEKDRISAQETYNSRWSKLKGFWRDALATNNQHILSEHGARMGQRGCTAAKAQLSGQASSGHVIRMISMMTPGFYPSRPFKGNPWLAISMGYTVRWSAHGQEKHKSGWPLLPSSLFVSNNDRLVIITI